MAQIGTLTVDVAVDIQKSLSQLQQGLNSLVNSTTATNSNLLKNQTAFQNKFLQNQVLANQKLQNQQALANQKIANQQAAQQAKLLSQQATHQNRMLRSQSSWSAKMTAGLSTLVRGFGLLTAALGVGFGISAIKAAFDYVDALGDVAGALGLTIKETFALQVATKNAGASFNQIQGIFSNLENALSSPTDKQRSALERLGFSAGDIVEVKEVFDALLESDDLDARFELLGNKGKLALEKLKGEINSLAQASEKVEKVFPITDEELKLISNASAQLEIFKAKFNLSLAKAFSGADLGKKLEEIGDALIKFIQKVDFKAFFDGLARIFNLIGELGNSSSWSGFFIILGTASRILTELTNSVTAFFLVLGQRQNVILATRNFTLFESILGKTFKTTRVFSSSLSSFFALLGKASFILTVIFFIYDFIKALSAGKSALEAFGFALVQVIRGFVDLANIIINFLLKPFDLLINKISGGFIPSINKLFELTNSPSLDQFSNHLKQWSEEFLKIKDLGDDELLGPITAERLKEIAKEAENLNDNLGIQIPSGEIDARKEHLNVVQEFLESRKELIENERLWLDVLNRNIIPIELQAQALKKLLEIQGELINVLPEESLTGRRNVGRSDFTNVERDRKIKARQQALAFAKEFADSITTISHLRGQTKSLSLLLLGPEGKNLPPEVKRAISDKIEQLKKEIDALTPKSFGEKILTDVANFFTTGSFEDQIAKIQQTFNILGDFISAGNDAASLRFQNELDQINFVMQLEQERWDLYTQNIQQAGLENSVFYRNNRRDFEEQERKRLKTQRTLQRQQWDADKKARLTDIFINTAQAITNALATVKPFFPLGLIMAAFAAASGAKQYGAVNSTKNPYTGFIRGGFVEGQNQGRDSVPSILQPGEAVIPLDIARRRREDVLDLLEDRPSGGKNVNITINGPIYGTREFVQRTLIPEIRKSLRDNYTLDSL